MPSKVGPAGLGAPGTTGGLTVGGAGAKKARKPFKFNAQLVARSEVGQLVSQISATINGIGTETVALTGSGALAGIINGVGTETVALTGVGALAVLVSGVGTIVAALSGTGALSSTISGSGSVIAALGGIGAL